MVIHFELRGEDGTLFAWQTPECEDTTEAFDILEDVYPEATILSWCDAAFI